MMMFCFSRMIRVLQRVMSLKTVICEYVKALTAMKYEVLLTFWMFYVLFIYQGWNSVVSPSCRFSVGESFFASFPRQEEFKGMIEDAGFYCVQYHNLTGGVVALHSGFKLWDWFTSSLPVPSKRHLRVGFSTSWQTVIRYGVQSLTLCQLQKAESSLITFNVFDNCIYFICSVTITRTILYTFIRINKFELRNQDCTAAVLSVFSQFFS